MEVEVQLASLVVRAIVVVDAGLSRARRTDILIRLAIVMMDEQCNLRYASESSG